MVHALDCWFHMDVASPGFVTTPWIPANRCITENSLSTEWKGFVWMNPPFGGRNGLVPWLRKFFEHGNGIALVPDRTSAPWWQMYATQADLVLFITPKIKFIGADKLPGKSPAQGTCLFGRGRASIQPMNLAEKHGLGTLMTSRCLPSWAR